MKRNKREPINVSETCWFYEYPKYIDLVLECRKDGIYHQTQIVKIPKRLLRLLALRAGQEKK